MLLVVTDQNVHKYRDQVDELFRLRYENFIVRRQWSLPVRNGMDVDQYDNKRAVYFILYDRDRKIVGSARVHDTMHASLLADLFPHLVESGEAPRGPGIFEGTRFIISPALKSRSAQRAARADLVAAIARWCLEQGGTHLQAVIDANMFQSFVAMSLKTRPLGLPHEYGGGSRVPGGGKCIAFRWALSPQLIEDFEAYGQATVAEDAVAAFEAIH